MSETIKKLAGELEAAHARWAATDDDFDRSKVAIASNALEDAAILAGLHYHREPWLPLAFIESLRKEAARG